MKENGQLHQIKKKWEMTKPDCSPLRQQAQCSKIQKFLFWIMYLTRQLGALSKRDVQFGKISVTYYWVFFWLKLTLFWKSQKRIPMMPKQAILKVKNFFHDKH